MNGQLMRRTVDIFRTNSFVRRPSGYFVQKSWISTKLSEQITPDLKTRLAGNVTARKFKLVAIMEELSWLEKAEFPLPKSLSDSQWKHLINFENAETRARYLDALLEKGDLDGSEVEELRELDSALYGPLELDPAMIDELVGEDEVKKQRIEELKRVHEAMLLDGKPVLPHVDRTTLLGILESDSKKKIASALSYLAVRQFGTFNDYIKKRARQAKVPEMLTRKREEKAAQNHIVYGLGHNTLFMMYPDRKMERGYDSRVIREYHEWGQPLVIDLSFVKTLNMQYVKSLFFREIPFGLKANRERQTPLPVYFTSYDHTCEKCRIIEKAFPRIMDPAFPAVLTEKSYLDLFPPEKLLYLTPDSRNDLMKHDPEDVYIIGAVIDIGAARSPRTLSVAKKQGIRHARFPTKRFVGMQLELNVDHAIAMISEFKNTKDWFYACRWIPPRFFKNRLKSCEYTVEMEAIYHAQHELGTTTGDHVANISPQEYRRRYKTLVEEFLHQNQTPTGKKDDGRYNWKRSEYMERKFGFLDLM